MLDVRPFVSGFFTQVSVLEVQTVVADLFSGRSCFLECLLAGGGDAETRSVTAGLKSSSP